jgi:lipopolysaccharide heptosyltransferase II
VKKNISKIVIRGLNWIGDSIIALPALREIRRIFPEAHIALLVRPWVRDLFVGGELADEVIEYSRQKGMLSVFATAQILRGQRFDAAILLQNAFDAAALTFISRIPIRIGFPTDGRRLLLTHPLKLTPFIARGSQMSYYLSIAEQTEILFRGASHVDFLRPKYQLHLGSERLDAARQNLKELGLDFGKRLLVINPGATNSRAKRWLPDRFALLADRLLEHDDCNVVFIGAAAESEIANQIIAQMRGKPVNMTGRTTLMETMAILSSCDLLVSNDTGPAYVSAALCRPTLSIFGPTDYWSLCATSPTSHLISRHVECAPCLLKDCPIDHRCMTAISVDEVYSKAVELLAKN